MSKKREQRGFLRKVVDSILLLPRVLRILIAAVIALLTILAVSPIVDEIYLSHFYSPNTRLLPALVTVSLGLAMYIAGWKLIVGTVGETLEGQRAVVIYFAAGLVSLALVSNWLIRLLTLGGV